MTTDQHGDFPIVRRGYDTDRVDRRLDEMGAELDRLAAENRALHRGLLDATIERNGITAPVRAEVEAARAELDQLIRAAHTERELALADVAAARAELDRLAQLDRDRAFAEVETVRAERDRVLAEIAAGRAELVALQALAGEPAVADVQSARAERDRARAEVEAARAELDRLLRARIEVHRELSTLGEALRRWLGKSVGGESGQFLPPPSRALAPRQPGAVSRNPR